MSSFAFISPEFAIDVQEIINISSALVVDPKAIRTRLLDEFDVATLSEIAASVVTIGPRPDRVRAKLNRVSNVSNDIKKLILSHAQRLDKFQKDNSIRITQFQAAFPDLIYAYRLEIKGKGGPLQRFVDDSVLPIEYQFPGSGPILPKKYRTESHYFKFQERLSFVLSQGQLEMNRNIVQASIEWYITDDSQTGETSGTK